MDVSLTPELEEFVLSRLRTGNYQSASDVVSEALRLMEDREKLRTAELREFREEVESRLATLDKGEGMDGEEVFARIRKKSEDLRNRHT